MSDWFLGEIRACSFSFAPKGWALCNGQILAISQNQALFSLLGTNFGGDGRVTFALPDLRGQVPLHVGPQFPTVGARVGEEAHTLIQTEMPAHNHFARGSGNSATVIIPGGNVFATSPANVYAQRTSSQPTTVAPQTIGNAGGSLAHENRQPFSVISFCIALTGIYPSRP